MAIRICLNCVYVCCDPVEWLRCHDRDEPLVPRCANHPQWPGQMHDVPGTPCRNYQPKPPEPGDDVRYIPLGDGQYAIVDAADYEWLRQYHWRLQGGYAARRENDKTILMHREITQAPPGKMVDHMNHNKVDNRRINLRDCTRQQNTHNNSKHSNSSSRFKGVGYHRERGKWFAKIWFEGARVWLGYFLEEVEAAHAYDRKAAELFGAFAHLNFSEEWPPARREKVYAEAQPLRDALAAKAAQAKAAKGKGKRARQPVKGKKEKGKSKKARAKMPERQKHGHRRPDAKRTRKNSPRKGQPRKR